MPEWIFASLRNDLHLAFLDKTRTAKRSNYRLFQVSYAQAHLMGLKIKRMESTLESSRFQAEERPVDNDRHLREDQVHHVANTKRVSWKYLPTGLGMAKS
ncbi:hypothetical protein PAAG_07612 [Paracoccidioides lutzii Pb01]|uniref:Uncharacterized protein n=1 Tax=Paracoccidioides lutzii (strain ATCC MYA-826 / Pb01) TaxID=502779 RepID=C1HAF8_PARBA|nr:hypothetical protein PAAG_07612 [Paracoccidioides lutzii Pb01]EEH37331.2 hypothetical protein PAAG_07612 [Paracoccidioides lutzii Pb01]